MTIDEIKLLIHDTVDTSTSTFADARMVRGLNKSQDKVVKILKKNDNLKEWDDNNWTDLPEGLLDIVSGQNDYDLSQDENFSNFISVLSVHSKDNAASTEFKKLNKTGRTVDSTTGIPTEYRMLGKTLIVTPEPDYSLTDGIKVLFVREPKPILVADTIKEPGVPSLFHNLLVLDTAYDYARAKNLASKNDILAELRLEERELGISISQDQDVDIDTVIKHPEINSI